MWHKRRWFHRICKGTLLCMVCLYFISLTPFSKLSNFAYALDSSVRTEGQLHLPSNVNSPVTGTATSLTAGDLGLHTDTLSSDSVITDIVAVPIVADPTSLPPVADGLIVSPTVTILAPDQGIVEALLLIDNQNVQRSLRWDAIDNQSWLNLSATTGSTPDQIVVSLSDLTLPAGTYIATITITSPDLPGIAVVAQVQMIRQADLSVTETVTPNPVIAGNKLLYTLEVVNNGPAPVSNVAVTDELPSGVTFDPNTSYTNCTLGSGPIICRFTTMASGEQNHITIGVTVAPTVTDGLNITNTVHVSHSGIESNSENNTALATTRVIRQADLKLNHSDLPDRVDAGSLLTFSLAVTNDGPSVGSNIIITDVLPHAMIYNPAASSPICTEMKGIVICKLASLMPTITANVPIAVAVDPSIEDRDLFTNTARLTASEVDPNGNNNQSVADVIVTRRGDLSITQKQFTNPIFPGDQLLYELTLRNHGDSFITGVVLTDTLPISVTFTAHASSPECTAIEREVTCKLGTMPDMAHKIVRVAATSAATITAWTVLTNTAGVRGDEVERDSSNNTSIELTTLSGRIYLPFVADQDPIIEEVDLIVKAINVTTETLEVVIQNIGAGPLLPGSDFWVDVYINPNLSPQAVNQTWQHLGKEGLVWGAVSAALRLNSGEKLRLRVNDSYYFSTLRNEN